MLGRKAAALGVEDLVQFWCNRKRQFPSCDLHLYLMQILRRPVYLPPMCGVYLLGANARLT